MPQSVFWDDSKHLEDCIEEAMQDTICVNRPTTQNPHVFVNVWADLAFNMSKVNVEVWVDDSNFLFIRLVSTGWFGSPPSANTLEFIDKAFRIAQIGEDFDFTSIRVLDFTSRSAMCLTLGRTCYFLRFDSKSCSVKIDQTPLIDITSPITNNGIIELKLDRSDVVKGLQLFCDEGTYYVIRKFDNRAAMVSPKRLV